MAGRTLQGDTDGKIHNHLVGGNFGDDIDGKTGNDFIWGLGGDDDLKGGSGNDVLIGGAGNDDLEGGPNDDVLSDGTGRNELRGGDGDDVLVGTGKMFGGAGEDTLIATGGAQVWGGPGADILIGSGGNVMYNLTPSQDNPGKHSFAQTGVTVDLLNGWGKGGDAQGDKIFGFTGIVGSHGDDKLTGDGQSNFFRGMDGADYFNGGLGDEIGDMVSFWGDNGGAGATVDLSTPVNPGETEPIFGASGGYAEGDTFREIENLYGSKHNDIFTGNGKRNWLSGQDGDDRLHGMAGNDSLGGGKGTDTLNGGKGLDDLSGNEGTDTFVFDNDSLPGGTGTLAAETDRVWDFSGLRSDGVKQEDEDGDKLDLSGLKTAKGLTKIEFKGTDAFSAGGASSKIGEVRYWHHVQDNPPEGQHGKWTKVAADLTGDGNADFQVELYGHLDLTVSDFVGVEAAIA